MRYLIGPILILTGLLLWLCGVTGCTTVTYYPPKGGYIKITSGPFDKKIGKVTFLEDGSFEIEGYQSDLQSMVRLSESLAKKIPAGI